MRIIIEDDNIEIKYKDETILDVKEEEKEKSILNEFLPDVFIGKIMINSKKHYNMIKDVIFPPFILIIETINHHRKMITTDGISKYEDLSKTSITDTVECFIEEMEYGVVIKSYNYFLSPLAIKLIENLDLYKNRYKITVLGDEENE